MTDPKKGNTHEGYYASGYWTHTRMWVVGRLNAHGSIVSPEAWYDTAKEAEQVAREKNEAIEQPFLTKNIRG